MSIDSGNDAHMLDISQEENNDNFSCTNNLDCLSFKTLKYADKNID